MRRRPPRSTRTDTLFPYTTLFRSLTGANCARWLAAQFAGDAGDGHGRCSTPMNEPAGRSASKRRRSEEHTSELQSLMRISYAVFCLKKKKRLKQHSTHTSNGTEPEKSNASNTISQPRNTQAL